MEKNVIKKQIINHFLATPILKDYIELINTHSKIYLESKINILLNRLAEDENTENLLNLIELTKHNEEAKNFFLHIIFKTFNSHNEIKIFILAQIYKNYIKNNFTLTYFEENILNSIDNLSNNDFYIICYLHRTKKIKNKTKFILKSKKYACNFSKIYFHINNLEIIKIFFHKMHTFGYFTFSHNIYEIEQEGPPFKALEEYTEIYTTPHFNTTKNYEMLKKYLLQYSKINPSSFSTK
jgi:hypothetical protein